MLYAEPHPKENHPIQNIPFTNLYPYTSQNSTVDSYIPEGLPEGRWYRTSKTNPQMITVQRPTTGRVTKESQIRIPKTVLWTLIAWHHISHETQAKHIREYDKRAFDIWEEVCKSKETSGNSTLCWATNKLLLDIIIDECGCTEELFSNILNTYYRFKTRRMLHVPPSFAKHGGIQKDGLAPEAYSGPVYGNPPFDGKETNKDTINKTLNMAQQAAATTQNFRSIYFLPLTKKKLKQRCKNKHTTLIMSFPNNTVSFIPDGCWYGGTDISKCYNEPHTNLVLLKIESEETNKLKPINMETLKTKLAAWYIHTTPSKGRTRAHLEKQR